MLLLFVALLGGYFGFSATHHTALAITCLVHALLMIHPIRALVLFCLGAAGTALVGAVRLVLPDSSGPRRRDPLLADGPRFDRSEPGMPSVGTTLPVEPAVPLAEPRSWLRRDGWSEQPRAGQPGPFLDRRARRSDRRR